MPITHLILIFLVIIVWGINFIFVKLALTEMTPMWLCVIRFLLASLPAILFIKKPNIPFRLLFSYGTVMFAMQFGLIFMGMHLGMTAGLASLLMQVQVFFSMFFAAILLKERPTLWQIAGALISFSGIGLVASHLGQDQTITLTGLLCVLAAAASWGIGNLLTKKASHVNMISLVVWGSFVAALPMLIFAFIFEGKENLITSVHHLSWQGIISILYIVYASTWLGYGLWNWLLGRYPVSSVVPFTLLIPIVGLLSSVIFLNETFHAWKLAAGILVIGGLCINLLGARLFHIRQHR